MIRIHYNFTDGTEMPYLDVAAQLKLNPEVHMNTCCLDFFTTDCPADDVVIVDWEGNELSRNHLMENDGTYCVKEIRPAHNIHKMFVANSFNWRENG